MAGHIPLTAQFTSGVSLVEVYATVTDLKGQPVEGLTAADFAVDEDGQPQSVAVFAAGTLPLALAVAVDRSFSMSRERLAMVVSAVKELVGGLRADDEVMVLAIGSTTDIVAPLSRDHRRVQEALHTLEPWGTTPLYDAAMAAIDAIQTANGRRALILLSDGDDRYSETSASDLLARARRSDVIVYPVAVGRARPPVFAELAAATGGRSLHATEPRPLSAALAAIARELRSQYLLGYTPAPDAGARAWRSIRVRVARPGVTVRARDGYFTR
jgi:Ca-activated chloride channel family protein